MPEHLYYLLFIGDPNSDHDILATAFHSSYKSLEDAKFGHAKMVLARGDIPALIFAFDGESFICEARYDWDWRTKPEWKQCND